MLHATEAHLLKVCGEANHSRILSGICLPICYFDPSRAPPTNPAKAYK